MILELGAGGTPLACGAAALVLAVHVTAGGVGVASGAMAMLAPKGSGLHRRAGNWFLGGMLTMALVGAAVASFLPEPQWSSTYAGLFTAYLVGTGWLTARHQDGGAGALRIGAPLCALGIAAAFLALGVMGQIDGNPAPPAFVFAAVAALAAGGDLKVILRRGISGTRRLVRHLWRMSVGWFIATASFFLGQPQVFPEPLRGSFALFVPELAVLGLLVYWLIRMRRAAGGKLAAGFRQAAA